EPAFARLLTVEVYAGGPGALERRDLVWKELSEELVPAEIREAPVPAAVAVPASTGAVDALLYERVGKNELNRVLDLPPLLTYLMLNPYTRSLPS
ncbi:MAG TPA: hypothetical protein VN732_07295, partial [Solirubrobacterales bacterium]|nr:hypothetical protein [Solirubrobacterales bacterium]